MTPTQNLIEAAEQALSVLIDLRDGGADHWTSIYARTQVITNSVNALRVALAAKQEQQAEPIGYVHPSTLELLENYTHCAMFRPGDQTEGSIALYAGHPPAQQAAQPAPDRPPELDSYWQEQFDLMREEIRFLKVRPAPEVPAGCLWAVTKGGHTICQPPKNWGKQPAPEVPSVPEGWREELIAMLPKIGEPEATWTMIRTSIAREILASFPPPAQTGEKK